MCFFEVSLAFVERMDKVGGKEEVRGYSGDRMVAWSDDKGMERRGWMGGLFWRWNRQHLEREWLFRAEGERDSGKMSVEQLAIPPIQKPVFSDHLPCHIQDSMSSCRKQEHCYLPSQVVVPAEGQRMGSANGPCSKWPFYDYPLCVPYLHLCPWWCCSSLSGPDFVLSSSTHAPPSKLPFSSFCAKLRSLLLSP